MSNRPRGYGLTAEIKNKMAAKYDMDTEQEAREWMEAVTGEEIVAGADPDTPLGPKDMQAGLKDGIYLCKLASIVMAPQKVKHNTMKMAFKQMENINNFLTALEGYGVAKTDLFQTVDLYENQNMWQVICTIHAFGRKAQTNGFTGPCLGPKESTQNKRDFDAEVLKAGQGVIGLQMGTNKMASQKGMSFGGQRFIADMKLEGASKEGQGVIGLQMGTNQMASQKGMSFGASRHINDPNMEEATKEGQAVIGLQMGTNSGASQAGMNIGKTRAILD